MQRDPRKNRDTNPAHCEYMAPPCYYHELAQVHANYAADVGFLALVGLLESYQT